LPLPQLGRFDPVVVQNAFGLFSPEFPLQGDWSPGQTCIFLAETVPVKEGATASAIVAAMMTAAIINVLVSMGS
jgi:hypothetical protein